MEIVPQLARFAAERLKALGYTGFHLRENDGRLGWPEAAPFDRVLCARCHPDRSNPPPRATLSEWPHRASNQQAPPDQVLTLIEKSAEGEVQETAILPVAFVPLTWAASS